jgi:hypothetical protein
MKRLSNEESATVKAAVDRYWDFIDCIEKDDFDNELEEDVVSHLDGDPEYEFAKGFFVGSGLSLEEASDAAEYVCGNGW